MIINIFFSADISKQFLFNSITPTDWNVLIDWTKINFCSFEKRSLMRFGKTVRSLLLFVYLIFIIILFVLIQLPMVYQTDHE